jgi:hypothetical protein
MKHFAKNSLLVTLFGTAILLASCAGGPAAAEVIPPENIPTEVELKGTWEGLLESGTQSFPVVFRSDRNGNWFMDSPKQNVTGIEADLIIRSSGKVKIDVPLAQGYFEGVYTEAGTLEGTWYQAGYRVDLILQKTED